MLNRDERIEVLSVDYLDSHRTIVEEFRALGVRLKQGFGWHYLLDFPWAASHLPVMPGAFILDAGAGYGLMQWWLADKGVNVISVDRVNRQNLPAKFRRAYRVRGLRPDDLSSVWKRFLKKLVPPIDIRKWPAHSKQVIKTIQTVHQSQGPVDPAKGTIYLYNQDLTDLHDIESGSVDAVVSISALEHNPPAGLRACLQELMRVLKSGGKLIATLGAARDEDWYHEPSKGWCYTEATLRDIFDLPADCPSNYDRYDELFEALRNCAELRDNLPDFYFKSGKGGMPWGVWDPKYQPVGVVKQKDTTRVLAPCL
jgi:SAM-dependent methyltransferase